MDAKSLKVVQENRDYTMFSWSVQGASNPIHMKRGQGVWFWDGDDQRWLDFSSQLINLNVGHQHPKISGGSRLRCPGLIARGGVLFLPHGASRRDSRH